MAADLVVQGLPVQGCPFPRAAGFWPLLASLSVQCSAVPVASVNSRRREPRL